ncbi:LOW QUALITY PROTEIN: uncharacterized protein LOC112978424 [Apteryx rowi]|uniref:LOW QUALITY PROTEIN: uncharacterized protein LOC112978424 n=1 Tax=Apteryx rowi TaxID=308060 RepID=UPI000E1DDC0D|nr:LOW QUALITY PROTEIN: uncharacterized protein LOC112978424 [Apteryx rowi]
MVRSVRAPGAQGDGSSSRCDRTLTGTVLSCCRGSMATTKPKRIKFSEEEKFLILEEFSLHKDILIPKRETCCSQSSSRSHSSWSCFPRSSAGKEFRLKKKKSPDSAFELMSDASAIYVSHPLPWMIFPKSTFFQEKGPVFPSSPPSSQSQRGRSHLSGRLPPSLGSPSGSARLPTLLERETQRVQGQEGFAVPDSAGRGGKPQGGAGSLQRCVPVPALTAPFALLRQHVGTGGLAAQVAGELAERQSRLHTEILELQKEKILLEKEKLLLETIKLRRELGM